MPIKIPDTLPARTTLEHENIFVMTEHRAMHQNIRPLKLITQFDAYQNRDETQLLRNSPTRRFRFR